MSSLIQELLVELFDALASTSVEFVVARNYRHYPQSVTGDVDLVIPKGDQDRAVRVIVDTARSCGWGPFLVIQRGYLAYVGLVAASPAGERGILVVELFDGGVWAGMPFLPARSIVDEARVWRAGWRIPRPGHEAAITAFHHLLWNGEVPRKYWDQVSSLARRDQEGFTEASRFAFGGRLGGVVSRAVARSDFGALSGRSMSFRFSVSLRNLLRRQFPMTEVAKALLGRREVGGGLVFAIVGGDSLKLGTVMMDLADEWHIGSPAARDRLHLEGVELPAVDDRVEGIRARGGVMLFSADSPDHLECVHVVCDAVLPLPIDGGAPIDVAAREGWRRLLASVAHGSGG